MKNKPISRDVLKLIAIVAMTFDHIGWFFVDFYSPTAQIFHFAGRITAPVMCFFIAEGYIYTSDKRKYALRLFAFALISQLPWWMVHRNFPEPSFNMMFTLFLCVVAIEVYEKVKEKALRSLLIVLIVFFTVFCDWHIYAVIWTLIFHIYRENEKKKLLWFSVVSLCYFAETCLMSYSTLLSFSLALKYSLYSLGTFMALILIMFYSGKKGRRQINKWFFYCYYPAHILIIALINTL